MTFIGQRVLHIRRKLRRLDGVLGMNPSQLLDMAFNVYNAQEIRKFRQATAFLEIRWGNQRKRRNLRGRRKDPLGASQCAHCKEEGHSKRGCPKLKREKR